MLENRRMLSANYWPLSAASLLQDWEDTSLITVNDDWSGVPSIEGYNIRNSSAGEFGQDPQTKLTEHPTVVGNPGTGFPYQYISVIANSTTSAPNSRGWFETTAAAVADRSVIGTNTVGPYALDSTAAQSALKIYVDNTGRTEPVRIRYDVIDINTGSGAAIQQVALQYRIITAENPNPLYTNLPEGYIANATSPVAFESGLTNSVDVTLPSDTIGAGQIQIRIVANNGPGVDQLIAIDNIKVFGQEGGPGFVKMSDTKLNAPEGSPSSILLERPEGSSGAITVDYIVTAGTATAGVDYTLTAGSVSFGANDLTASIPFTPVNDGVSEGPERFTVTLTNVTGGGSLNLSPATLTTTVVITDVNTPTPALGSLLLNEIVANPIEGDQAEYIEIRGTPGQSLNNVQVITLEGDTVNGGNTGMVNVVFDLSGYVIPASGLVVVQGASGTYPNHAPGTLVIVAPQLGVQAGVLRADSETFALIFDPTPFDVGQDLDTNPTFDGSLDALPASSVILDIIGVSDAVEGTILANPDRFYGPVIYGFGNTSISNGPDAIVRVVGDNTPGQLGGPVSITATHWYGGDLIDPSTLAPTSTELGALALSLTNRTANTPDGAVITPGAPNYPSVAAPGAFGFSPITYSVVEEAGGLVVTVYRAGGTAGTVSVDYGAVGGTATAGVDYAPIGGTLTFGPGEVVKTFFVTILDDSDPEGAETIDIALSNPTGGATLFEPGTARITITKSDPVMPVGLLINEMLINPAGTTETPAEYLELRGEPNTTLVDVYLVVVEGDSAENRGVVDALINLTGAKIGSNGLLLVGSNVADQGFASEDPNTGFFGIANYSASGAGFENGSNTYLLIYAPPADPPAVLPVVGTDYDPSNLGGRQFLSFDSILVVLDSFAINDGGANDAWYADTVLGPPTGATTFVGGAVSRFPDDDRANVDTAFFPSPFYYGVIATDPNAPVPNQSKLYSTVATERSDNFPAGATRITPGSVNHPAADAIPPTVQSVTFDRVAGQKLVVVFSEDVRNTTNGVVASDFTLTNSIDSSTVDLVIDSISPDGTTVTLTFANTAGVNNSILKDGNYVLTVKAGQVADLAGNTLAADSDNPFKFKNADATGDHAVTFDDLLALAQHYGGTSGKTYANGDFNYDGAVTFEDLLILAQNYGGNLPALLAAFEGLTNPTKPAAPAKAPTAATSRKPSFGSTVIA